MITKNSYRIRTLPNKHSYERFGYQYQPVLIEGIKLKQNRVDFLGLRCYEPPIAVLDDTGNEEKIFILNHMTREMTRNNFDLTHGCKLILMDGIYECLYVNPHDEETYHPAVIAKRLPYNECYKEPFNDYLSSLSNTHM